MTRERRGPIAWMAQNAVAANLLMGVFIIGGLVISGSVKQEVFPEFSFDQVNVSVAYPGASPEEVEKGVLIAIEEAIRGLDGIKEVISSAGEGMGSVRARLLIDADQERALTDIRGAVDRVRSLPEEIERPTVSLLQARQRSISVVVYGDVDHETLREQAEIIRAGLVATTLVSQAEVTGLPLREISVEITEENQRRYGLTLDQVAQRIRNASIELPSGRIRSASGELLIRTAQRRELGQEFGDVLLVSQRDGTQLRLRDVAKVTDGFEEDQPEIWFNGSPAIEIQVYRVGNQTPIEITEAVTGYLADNVMPRGITARTWSDKTKAFVGRIDLLKRNAISGLILVFVILGLFLEIRLAFWVMLGIPISFCGAFIFMSIFGASINMVSMFAFILVLGIVVDDAIVVGENIFRRRNEGMGLLDAAIQGAREVATPVFFAIATTVATFGPLLFVPGFSGKIFGMIPIVVIAVLFISLIESVFILPAHLAHSKQESRGLLGAIIRQQLKVSRLLERFIDGVYVPLARVSARHRYATMALAMATLIMTVGAVRGGFFSFSFLPKLESDFVTATVQLPLGTPLSTTRGYRDQLQERVDAVLAKFDQGGPVHEGILAVAGGTLGGGGGPGGERGGGKSPHVAQVRVNLVPQGERAFSSGDFARAWREAVGEMVGVERLNFRYSFGGGAGDPINVQLAHRDITTLEEVATRVAEHLESINGVTDVYPGYSPGKEQLNVKLSDQGRALGLTERELASALRSAYYGSEALRQQRGRDEVRVLVRRPRADRVTRASLERMVVRTRAGREIPLSAAAHFDRGRAYSSIRRIDGRRTINVTSDIDNTQANANRVLNEMRTGLLTDLVREVPGLTYSLEGQRREQSDSLGSLGQNFLFALLVIYCLLAIPFRSYAQPLVVMSAIPFGGIGALIGHQIMGFDLSIISIMGMVALSGVVVNDSLILLVATNEIRRDGASAEDAAVLGGARRFRPILLTSLTTAFGLAPMIFETSIQARFLVPMAVSLGFGILWATVIILFCVPALYLILEDVNRAYRWLYPEPPPSATSGGEREEPAEPSLDVAAV